MIPLFPFTLFCSEINVTFLKGVMLISNEPLLRGRVFYFSLQVDNKEKATPEVSITRSPGSDVSKKYFLPANSLVQSVLEARAMRDNKLELRPVSQMF